MNKINDGRKITQYSDGDFIITIIVFPSEGYEAWLCHKDYGIMQFMYHAPARFATEEEFISVVEADLEDFEGGYLADMEGEQE